MRFDQLDPRCQLTALQIIALCQFNARKALHNLKGCLLRDSPVSNLTLGIYSIWDVQITWRNGIPEALPVHSFKPRIKFIDISKVFHGIQNIKSPNPKAILRL